MGGMKQPAGPASRYQINPPKDNAPAPSPSDSTRRLGAPKHEREFHSTFTAVSRGSCTFSGIEAINTGSPPEIQTIEAGRLRSRPAESEHP